VQFNNDFFLNWLNFDIDRPDSYESWEEASLPPPNLYVQNPSNLHGHLYYALATPIGTCDGHRLRPIEYAAAVQRGMTRRLDADPAYANRLAKNPLHPDWRASWIVAEPYDLATLREPLNAKDTRRYERRSELTGISRNCDLFEELRGFTYRHVLSFKDVGSVQPWVKRVMAEARALNTGFCPLSTAELRSITNSTAKWTWRRFSRRRFSEIQAERACGRATGALTAASVADALAERGDISKIADDIGKSARTVRRYLSGPRDQYENNSREHAKPWESEGISRATWYRRHH
jgi:hypothetical protein